VDLADVTVAVRPRTPWEAIDLGFAMARRWFVPLWTLWWMTALPVSLLSALLLHDHFWAMVLLAWWLKPLYEPPLQFWLSRALFGERLPLRDLIRRWPQLVRPRLFANLTWARLAPSRSFHMPVALLEGLRGKARSDRILLLGRGQQAGFWLTWVGVHFEIALELSLLFLLVLLLPDELQWLDWEDWFLSSGTLEHWLDYLGSLAAMSLIAPFYVAGGFALYLARRIELEAWDIEIDFRRMNERKQGRAQGAIARGAVPALVVTLFAVMAPVSDAEARIPSAEEAREVVQEVLADPDFGRKKQQGYWKYVGETDEAEQSDSAFEAFLEWLVEVFENMALVAELLMWGAIATVVIYVAYRIAVHRDWLRRSAATAGKRGSGAAVELFGLDLRPQNLPDDIVGAALALLDKGEVRESLSLLYRGTLSRLVHVSSLQIPPSATEGECRRLVRRRRPVDEAELFDRLTAVWTRMAYGHAPPTPDQVVDLADDWRTVFGRAHAG